MPRNIADIDISDLFLVLLHNIRDDYSMRGRTKIQKIMFILKNEFDLPHNFNYFLYTHGPYSITLQDEMDTLTTFGLVDETAMRAQNYLTYRYSLTRQGQEVAESIIGDLSRSATETIARMTARARELDEERLEQVIETAYEYVPTGIP